MSTLTQRRANRRNAVASAMRALRPIEQGYVDALRGIARAWAKAYLKELAPVLKERFDGQLPSTIDHLGVRVEVAIENHVGGLFDKSAAKVKKTATANTQSLIGIKPDASLQEVISKRRAENIQLIQQAHKDYVAGLRDLLENPDNFGMRSETMAAKLAERGDVNESRAELIARDQILTLNGQIVEEQQRSAGVERYVWSTSLDERVRPEHEVLEGQTFSWEESPPDGHPGEAILCRCVALPVIEELEGLF